MRVHNAFLCLSAGLKTRPVRAPGLQDERVLGRLHDKKLEPPYVGCYVSKGLGWIYFEAEFPETLEFVDEGAAADAEGFGGFRPVEIMFAQGLDDGVSFDVT